MYSASFPSSVKILAHTYNEGYACPTNDLGQIDLMSNRPLEIKW